MGNDLLALFCSDLDITSGQTPLYATDVHDLEEGGATDMQVHGWLNVRFSSDCDAAAADEGLDITLRMSDATNFSSYQDICSLHMASTDIVAGKTYSVGVHRDVCLRYLKPYIAYTSTEGTGTINVTISLESGPVTNKNIQKNITVGS